MGRKKGGKVRKHKYCDICARMPEDRGMVGIVPGHMKPGRGFSKSDDEHPSHALDYLLFHPRYGDHGRPIPKPAVWYSLNKHKRWERMEQVLKEGQPGTVLCTDEQYRLDVHWEAKPSDETKIRRKGKKHKNEARMQRLSKDERKAKQEEKKLKKEKRKEDRRRKTMSKRSDHNPVVKATEDDVNFDEQRRVAAKLDKEKYEKKNQKQGDDEEEEVSSDEATPTTTSSGETYSSCEEEEEEEEEESGKVVKGKLVDEDEKKNTKKQQKDKGKDDEGESTREDEPPQPDNEFDDDDEDADDNGSSSSGPRTRKTIRNFPRHFHGIDSSDDDDDEYELDDVELNARAHLPLIRVDGQQAKWMVYHPYGDSLNNCYIDRNEIRSHGRHERTGACPHHRNRGYGVGMRKGWKRYHVRKGRKQVRDRLAHQPSDGLGPEDIPRTKDGWLST